MDPVLLIFIGLAAFVIFRLVSVLGERTGHERQTDIEGLQRAARGADAAPERVEETRAEAPAPLAPVSAAARPLRDADPVFDEKEFLAGARAAYEMIVEAFGAGDLKSVRDYLAPAVYETFRRAVDDRGAAGRATELKFIGIDSAAIADARVEAGAMFAVVAFASNQVRVTRDASGAVVDGDPTRIDLVRDRWTFSRKISSRDPNWILEATG